MTIWTVTRGRSGVFLQEHRTMNIILRGIESIWWRGRLHGFNFFLNTDCTTLLFFIFKCCAPEKKSNIYLSYYKLFKIGKLEKLYLGQVSEYNFVCHGMSYFINFILTTLTDFLIFFNLKNFEMQTKRRKISVRNSMYPLLNLNNYATVKILFHL